MAADELAIEAGNDVGDGEVACFPGHFCIEEDLEEEVAEFVGEVGPSLALDGVENFPGLFEVQGTAARSTEAGHDSYGLGEEGAGLRIRFRGWGALLRSIGSWGSVLVGGHSFTLQRGCAGKPRMLATIKERLRFW